MFSLLSETEDVAVATLPSVKPKLQPVAGMVKNGAPPTLPPSMPPPAQPPPTAQQAPVPQAMRTVVFSAEARPRSPWTDGGANVPARRPMSAGMVLGTPTALPDADGGIESVRQLLFGQHMREVQTKVAELQVALNGEMGRLRATLTKRVDELAGFLHKDMVVLRNEMQNEMGQLKADLFAAATGLSVVKDRLINIESKTREEATALAEFDGRLLRQETAFASALDQLQTKLTGTIESKCAEALSILAKKSEVADMLAQMSGLVAQDTPGADPGWFSSSLPVAAAAHAATEIRMPPATGHASDGGASDWSHTVVPFRPDEGLIT